jgi:THO complex subunit 2
MVQPPPSRPQLTTIFPVPLRTHTTHYVYFYPGWSQALPICTQLDDCKTIIGGFLSLTKFQIYRNVLVFHRVLQLMTSHLLATSGQDHDATAEVKTFWYNELRSHILPAISMLRGNVGVVVDMFAITRYYDTTERWSLYAEWKTKTMQSHPELRLRFIQVDRESKGVMRRLSKQTVHTLDSAVLKLAIHNPCIFFPNAINQIMAYDNLAAVVLEVFSRLTNFAFDVLQYLIFDALSNPHKERVKDDGVNTSDWLQSLATFIGILYERYGMDLAPLLNYIAHQLHNRQATDIIILKELITHMCGIEPLPSLQNTQIEAMAGGPTLRVEAIASAQRGCRRNVGRRLYWSTNRLRDKLAETNLAFPLLVQVAQQRQSCVFQTTDAPLKSLSNLFDTVSYSHSTGENAS